MAQHGDFDSAHRMYHNYTPGISTGRSDARSFVALNPSQHPLPQPDDMRNYAALQAPECSAPWDGTLPNYGYVDTSLFRQNQDPIETAVRSGPQDPNPLLNWYTNNDGPWVPPGTVPDISMDHNQSRGRLPGFRSTASSIVPTDPKHIRDANASGFGGFPFVFSPTSDSGYATRKSFENGSVFSSPLRASLSSQSHDNRSFPMLQVSARANGSELSDSWAGSQSASAIHQAHSDALQCPTCGMAVKTKSELKKHYLRHQKPHRCTHPGCSRKDGFSTTNDLDRHQRSKHPSDSPRTRSKVYQCVFPNCKSQTKLWPRLDNFRCHIKRVHQLDGDPLETLVRRSEFQERPHSSGHADQHCSRGVQHEESGIQQGEFLRDLTILEKPPSIMNCLEEPEPEDCDRPSFTLYTMLRQPDDADFQSRAFRSGLGPFPGQSAIHDHLEIDSTHELNNDDISAVYKKSSGVGLRRREYPNSWQASSERQQGLVSGIASVLRFEGSNANVVGVHNYEEARASDMSSAIMSERSPLPGPTPIANPQFSHNAPTSLSCQEIGAMFPAIDADSVTQIIEGLKTRGYKIEKDMDAQESKECHSEESATPERSEAEANAAPKVAIESEQLTCKTCFKYIGRPSQMKKHLKRHERPYGCTFINCGKRFGSKDDWKRHENSQHFQSEVWRCTADECTQSSSSPSKRASCSKDRHRKESLKAHLIKEHQISDPNDVNEKLEKCRIGGNRQSGFWCGFCREIKQIRSRGLEAWVERFDHIDDHFFGRKNLKKQDITEWVHSKGGGLSGALHSTSNSEAVTVDTSDDSGSLSAITQRQNEVSTTDLTSGLMGWDLQGARKRQNDDDNESERPMKTARQSRLGEKRIICCQCESSHNPDVVVFGCIECEDHHRFCENCEYVEVDPCPRGLDG